MGFTTSFGSGDSDAYFVRTDCDGETLWTRTLGGLGEDVANSVARTSDGGYIVAGHTSSVDEGRPNSWLVKLNSEGETIWTWTGGLGVENSACQVADGGYIESGWYSVQERTERYGSYAKTDGNGHWYYSHSCGQPSELTAVAPTYDGGCIAAGFTSWPSEGQDDLWLEKIDVDGFAEWSRTFGGAGSDRAWSVVQARDLSYLAAGSTNSMGMGGTDAFVVRVSPSGDSLWARSYGNSGLDFASSICQNWEGDFLVAGGSDASYGAGGMDVFLFKLDIDGDVYWARYYGGSGQDRANAIHALPNGCIVVGSTTSIGAGQDDVYLLRTDRNGDLDN